MAIAAMKLMLMAALMLFGAISQDETCSADGSCEEQSLMVDWIESEEDMGVAIEEKVNALAVTHGLSNAKPKFHGSDGSEIQMEQLSEKTHYPITIKIMKPLTDEATAAADAAKKEDDERIAAQRAHEQAERKRLEEEEMRRHEEEKKRIEEEKQRQDQEKKRLEEEVERQRREAEQARIAEEEALKKQEVERLEHEKAQKEAEEADRRLREAQAEEAERLRKEKEKADEELRVRQEQARLAKEEADRMAAETKRQEKEAAAAQEAADAEAERRAKAAELHILKWRWAENLHLVPFVDIPVFTPRLPTQDDWNTPESRAALKEEIETKLMDVATADKRRYSTRKVEIADTDTLKTRTFENYLLLFEWMKLDVNVD